MSRPRLSNSIRKYIRRQKSFLRRQVLDPKEADLKIQEMLNKLVPRKNSGVLDK